MTIVSFHGAEWEPTESDPWGGIRHTYESIEQDAVRMLFEAGDHVAVAGVGFGFILAGVAARVGRKNVLGVEANVTLSNFVRENVTVNGFELNVVNAAITPTGEKAALAPARVWAVRRAIEDPLGLVPGMTLQDLLAMGYDCLLLDVEGGEWELLPQIDSRWRKVIIECHAPYELPLLEVWRGLTDRGLAIRSVLVTEDLRTTWIVASRAERGA